METTTETRELVRDGWELTARTAPHPALRRAASERRNLTEPEAYEILTDALRPVAIFLEGFGQQPEPSELRAGLPAVTRLACESARLGYEMHGIGWDGCPGAIRAVDALVTSALALHALSVLWGTLDDFCPDARPTVRPESYLFGSIAALVRTEYLTALDARDAAARGGTQDA